MGELTPEEEAAAAAREEEARRLRKARREAKIKAGAGDRLSKITGLASGVPKNPSLARSATMPASNPIASEQQPLARSSTIPVAPVASSDQQAKQHPDPAEVDISEHFYKPKTTPRPSASPAGPEGEGPVLDDAQLRRMMLGLDAPTRASTFNSPGLTPPAGAGAGAGALPEGNDPMMKLMMQMLGSSGGGGSNTNNPFAALMQQPPTQPGQKQQQLQQQPSKAASLWRILHTLIALSLGLYIVLATPFTGTKLSRDRAAAAEAGSAEERALLGEEVNAVREKFFWAFATAEAVLLGTRWFVDRGSRVQASGAAGGLVGLLVGFLPPAVKSRVELGMRYAEVVGRVRGDVLVCVFVLGVGAWWRG
ncbi:hypothetical protein VTJ49DRAFT_2223 [Mycothermus thermophilus]|uniref:GET complex subunit GET2 n=1 Tax=Humicola insolens TaxID=85995 RepID=A0ABR3VAY4_HUMIN